MTEALLHAIDLALNEEWQEAKDIVEALDAPLADRLFLLICTLEERESARGRQIATVRHEIGNAIAIAQANLEAMADGVLEATPARLESIVVALSGVGEILDDLRKPPKSEPGSEVVNLAEFDMCALIAAHVAAVAGMAKAKSVSVVYESCGAGFESCRNYRGDQTRVGQILRNVLLNAVRYTPPGGSIRVECQKHDAELHVSVRDTGTGIASADLPHVFEAGYRGKNGSGSGLGLSVVKKLVKAMGGEASIASAEGDGATFMLALPAQVVPSPPPA